MDLDAMNNSFDIFKNKFIEEFWELHIDWACDVGYHKFDSTLNIPNDDYRKSQLTFADSSLARLKEFDLNLLFQSNKIDWLILENQLKYMQFTIIELKSHEWDPSCYNVSCSFAEIL